MITLISGGSGSGKSAYAEEYIVAVARERTKYYLATMQAFDPESQAKIKRHQQLRSGKGFVTVEQPVDIHKAAQQMCAGERTALLECMSNLAANEMFSGGEPLAASAVAEKILREIRALAQEVSHLVIVSNNVFEDGVQYDETTMEYLRAMGNVNEGLAAMADEVIEVVVGIPVVIKKAV